MFSLQNIGKHTHHFTFISSLVIVHRQHSVKRYPFTASTFTPPGTVCVKLSKANGVSTCPKVFHPFSPFSSLTDGLYLCIRVNCSRLNSLTLALSFVHQYFCALCYLCTIFDVVTCLLLQLYTSHTHSSPMHAQKYLLWLPMVASQNPSRSL